MATNRLPNYLRGHRKRLGLTQREAALLLGAEGAAKMSRYENFNRTPSLETALACEVIFKKPVSELFAGLYQQVGRKVSLRAARKLKRSKEDGKSRTKAMRLLVELAGASDKKSNT